MMEKFTKVTGVAAPLPMINVDTDMIVPKQFLKVVKRTGLGKALFFNLRYDDEGNELEDFVLNRPAYRNAKVIVAGANFGCGSSREHAPWAIADYGIRCVIAPSFADIFYNNSFKNGLLLIRLPEADVEMLMSHAQRGGDHEITIDLPSQVVATADGARIGFDIDPFRKHCLSNGLDDIGLTLQRSAQIAAFEERRKLLHPWLR